MEIKCECLAVLSVTNRKRNETQGMIVGVKLTSRGLSCFARGARLPLVGVGWAVQL